MTSDPPTDWDSSAAAWIASLGETGDKGRAHVLDAPMLAHARASGAGTVLDVGCGEGRFCRMLHAAGMETTGIDPTRALLDRAVALHPEGSYLMGRAEALPLADAGFGLVVSYLSLIDIVEFRAAIAEMARVAAPGGTLLIANLTPHSTALPRDWHEGSGWVCEEGQRRYFAMDDYAAERSYWTSWAGIRIRNHHRPISAYMTAFLEAGLILRRFEEPPYTGPDPAAAEKYARAPWFNLMVWTKPGAPDPEEEER